MSGGVLALVAVGGWLMMGKGQAASGELRTRLHGTRGEPYADAYATFGGELAGVLDLTADEWAAVGFGLTDRESLCGQVFSPPGPKGTGDGGLAHGIWQVHQKYWPQILAAPGDPVHGARIAAQVVRQAAVSLSRELVGRAPAEALRAVVAAYNAGPGAVGTALRAGLEPDSVTTGKNYGRDVLMRAYAVWPAKAVA